jgi:hypothetical protein
MSLLAVEVAKFASSLRSLPDSALRQDWSGSPGEPGWQDYADNLSDISFSIYQKLRAFTVAVSAQRATEGPRMTETQRILAQHQLAYRDFHGVLAGGRDEELDLTPFEGKWSLRSNIAHLTLAECWSQGPQVRHAVHLYRRGLEPASMARASVADDEIPPDYGSLSELLVRFDSCHDKLIHEFAEISDEELDAPSVYWEDEPVSIRFRLYRFAWHIRSHTMQADRIRIALGHRLTDMDRFGRLLYSALGDAEGALIGAGESQRELERDLIASINARASELITTALSSENA